MTRASFLAIAALVGVALLAVTGCGGAGTSSSARVRSGPTNASPGPAAGSGPQSGTGIVYKPASPEVNARAEAFVREIFADVDAAQRLAGEAPIICGPFLWAQIREHADVVGIEKGKAYMHVPTAEGILQLEGKLFQDTEEANAFWRSVHGTVPLETYVVRKLNQSEKEIYWALIAWDIEEPVLVVEGGGHRFIVDMVVEDDGSLKVFWIDDVAQLAVR